MASWKQSVTKARTALLKTFEGRMVAAEASFEQVRPNNSHRDGTLAQFARDIGIEYPTLVEYRIVWLWLGEDDRYIPVIRSYSVAKEAANSKQWSKRSATEFVEALNNAEKVVRCSGYEPYFFDEWTVDAVRAVLLGQQPKKTLLVQMTAIETGEDPTDEELDSAEQEDLIEDTIDRVDIHKLAAAVAERLHDEPIEEPIETPMDTAVAMAELERWIAEADLIISAVEDAVATGRVGSDQLDKPADDIETEAPTWVHRLRTAHERQADFDRGLEDLLRQGA
jgi:hypothetical protein